MLDHTDRHFRFFIRRITRRTLLYTEMVTTGALLHGDRERLLAYDEDEHPVALQLGGSNPHELAACARLGAQRGYDEVNLNVGCPSERVRHGRFGACLMAEPQLVADCVRALRDAVDVPVTVKHRIGIDALDSYEALCVFVGTIADAGCDACIVHARKAWLSGLSPKENRNVPPLRYEVVHRLKRDFPQLPVVINGGIESLAAAGEQLAHVDGVMIGRAAYHDPWLLADADERIFGSAPRDLLRLQVAEAMLGHLEAQTARGVPGNRVTRHMLGLFHGVAGARAWRRALSAGGHVEAQGTAPLRAAIAAAAASGTR
jgi:tRNA-dihydrouridine synthase A